MNDRSHCPIHGVTADSPLDRIEDDGMYEVPGSILRELRELRAERPALVNVAKAAEPIAESVPRGLAVGKDELWALVEAYEALAALDKEPA